MLLVVNCKRDLLDPESHHIPLSLHNHVLNDERITKAKEIAKEYGISEFNVIQLGDNEQKNIIYFGVAT